MKYISASIVSRSTKSRTLGRASITVTLMFKAVTIDAYSSPMTPAPTTIRSRGNVSPLRSWSESMIRLPSSVTVGECAGRVPQAIRMRPAVTGRSRRRATTSSVVRVDEAGGARDGRDAVAGELRADDLELPLDDLLDAKSEVGDGDLAIDGVVLAVERPLLEAREIEDRLPQRLRGDRAGVEADAADHLPAVDDGDPLAELGRRDRPLLAGRTAADHEEVVGAGWT